MNLQRVISPRGAVRALAVFVVTTAALSQAHGQGCVPVKQMGDISTSMAGLNHVDAGRWSVNFNYQGFRSHRHFVGHDEQQHRAEARSEVVNVVNQVTTTINYAMNSRTSFWMNVPYYHAYRTSLYEHDRVNRHETRSNGLGDISVGGQMWLRSPMSETRGNIAVGLGVQLPTGNTTVKDDFHTANGIVRRNVDQSIQPGLGGWGIAVSAQGYQRLGENTTLYASGFYLITPEETNGTYRSTNPITGRDSIYDQYQWRVGATQMFIRRLGLAASLGLRMDGVPALDLVGGDAGFRRPGYTISVEPGLAFNTGRDSFSLTVPVAISRSRQKSYVDRINNRHGDAAFADFLINFNYTHHW
jgi:hypothetical protein